MGMTQGIDMRGLRKGIARLGFVCIGLATAMAAAPAGAQESIEDYADDVAALAANDLQEWINDPFVIYAIREQNELSGDLSLQQIEDFDQRWRREMDGSEKPMIFDLLGRQASIVLRERREKSNGVITEIILMDKHGLNVAISDPTSDYYQGDEAKWLETYLVGPDAVHVGELEYDESTGKVQTQVSMSIVDPEDPEEAIGAVTFGVNLFLLRMRGG